MPPTINPEWSHHAFLLAEFASIGAIVAALAAPRIQRILNPPGRWIATAVFGLVITLAATILWSSWSFTGREWDGRVLATAFISLSALVFGWSSLLPGAGGRWLVYVLLGGPILVMAIFGIPGALGVARAERDRIPETQGQLDARHTYQMTIFAADHGAINGADLEIHSHPPGLPMLERLDTDLRYDKMQYQLDFLKVSLSPDGKRAVVARRRLDDSIETSELTLR